MFVTGASGFVGSALLPELIDAGHEVVALARSEASADAVAALGAEALRGDLEHLDSLRVGAESSDGVIHLAFIHDFSQYENANRVDQRAIDVFGEVLAGSERPFLIASGVGGLRADGLPVTERDDRDSTFPRAAAARTTLGFAERGVRSSVVRLAPTVHGEGDHGFVAMLIDIARRRGSSAYVGDGSGRWPAVHRFDAAHLFRLGLEKAPSGSVLHGVAEEGVATREIAEVIGHHLDVPVRSISADDAAEHFGFLGAFFGADLPASSTFTQELLDWHPTHLGLVEDLEKGHYFEQ